MSDLRGIYLIEEGKSRLYDHLFPFFTIFACVNVALVYITRGHAKFKLGDHGEAQCKQFTLKIRHPTGGLLETALAGQPIKVLPLEIITEPLTQMRNSVSTPAFQEIITNAISPIFVSYYENQKPWLEANVSNDTYQWPQEWNFARIVRNAASHSGTLDWRNPKAKSISWHHITYSAADKGRRIVGGDLILGDLLLLMLEMDRALDRLGCPG